MDSFYQDGTATDRSGLTLWLVNQVAPALTVKAIGTKGDGSPSSAVVVSTFRFITGTPNITGANAAVFTISDITTGAHLYYTLDGSDPSSTNANATDLGTVATSSNLWTVSLNITSNTLFRVRAFRNNYQPSDIASNMFLASAFQPNTITFGRPTGEPHSSFIARPGQFYYAPVTLQLAPGSKKMFSLQFNLTVTNGLTTSSQILNGNGLNFFPMLVTQVTPDEGTYYPPSDGNWYLKIPPFIYDTFVQIIYTNGVPIATNIVTTPQNGSTFTNVSENLLGVGWLYRSGEKYKYLGDPSGLANIDFDTSKQDLTAYSIAHDTLFTEGEGMVLVGAYSFQVPASATNGDKYFIQIGSPSATSDGVGAPGAGIFIQAPVSNQVVTVGSPSYIVGDVASFHWFNAGDFGDTNLDNSDVMQVYQAAILGVNMPPANSDMFMAMDSSGGFGVFDGVNNYYTNSGTATALQQQAMWDGNDQSINTNAFGDGTLDINDIYVTFRRSLDPSLIWFKRYWTNGQFVAVTNINYAFNSNTAHLLQPKSGSSNVASKTVIYTNSFVNFSAGDSVATAGQTVRIPITANILGNYRIHLLGLNLTVEPLDGSPNLTVPVQFSTGFGNPLGQPASGFAGTKGNDTYGAAWLNATNTGLTGNATVGTLIVTLPANATSSSAYAIRFDHASASPNGLVSFPKSTFTGLITTTPRTNSYYGDGIPDSWRLRYFGTVYNYLSVSNADADGDNFNNWQEYVAGTDPLNAKSNLRVAAGRVTSGQPGAISWPSVTGKQYVVFRSPTLFPAAWTPVATNSGTGTTMQFNDSVSGKQYYYRVSVH